MTLQSASDVTEEKKTGFTYRNIPIVLAKSRGHEPSPAVQKAMERGIYPNIKRTEAATLYAVIGDIDRTAELAKVSPNTLRSWRKEDWFKEIVRDVWAENNDLLNSKFTNMIQKAQDLLADRLENGDFKVLKNGEVVRVPISGKDLSLITAINFDKRQLLREGPQVATPEDGKVEKAVDKLEKLAETFTNLAKFGRSKTDVVDAIPVNET